MTMTTAPAWYYGRDGETVGPMPLQQLRGMAERGELRGDDSVWTDGMPNWVPASTRPELFPAVAAMPAGSEPVAPVDTTPRAAAFPAHAGGYAPHAHAHAPAGSVGYYAPGGNMPPRAVANLHQHTAPTGDTGDWPLDDTRVAAFRETMSLRKKVYGAAQLYRALFLLTAIFGGIALLVMALAGASGAFGRRGGGGPGGPEMMGFGVMGVILVGLGTLYFFAWRGTHRSQRWAPLTMFVLFMVGVAVNLLSFVAALGSGSPDAAAAMLVSGLVGSILPAVFGVVSWRAFAAIPRYLAQPAWCQELIATAKL